MEESKAAGHGDATGDDEEQAQAMEDGGGAAELLFLRTETGVGGEEHAAEPEKDEHDAEEMKEFDGGVVHGSAAPMAGLWLLEVDAGLQIDRRRIGAESDDIHGGHGRLLLFSEDCIVIFIQLCLQFLHFLEKAQEFFAKGGEVVLDAWRDFRELEALHDSRAGEVSQAVAKHLRADSRDVTLEFAGSALFVSDGAQDSDAPTTTNHILQQDFDLPGVEFRHEGQKFFVVPIHKFTPICAYPPRLCPLLRLGKGE